MAFTSSSSLQRHLRKHMEEHTDENPPVPACAQDSFLK
jgi:hypothetical protein